MEPPPLPPGEMGTPINNPSLVSQYFFPFDPHSGVKPRVANTRNERISKGTARLRLRLRRDSFRSNLV